MVGWPVEMPSASASCNVSTGYFLCRSRKGGAIFSGLGDTLSTAWQREQLLTTKVLPRCSAGVRARAEPVITRVAARQPRKYRITRVCSLIPDGLLSSHGCRLPRLIWVKTGSGPVISASEIDAAQKRG